MLPWATLGLRIRKGSAFFYLKAMFFVTCSSDFDFDFDFFHLDTPLTCPWFWDCQQLLSLSSTKAITLLEISFYF